MRFLLNTTVLKRGGALQLATSLTREALSDPTHEWHFAISPQVAQQLAPFFPKGLPRTRTFDETPAFDRSVRRQLVEYEALVAPDAVFTPYGPAYVEFAAPHLCGAADPWLAHADLVAFRSLRSPIEWIKYMLIATYHGYWFRKADALVVETEYTRQGYYRRAGVPLERVAVVMNTCGRHYVEHAGSRPFPAPGATVRFLAFAAGYAHKRLSILPAVARAVADLRPELDFRFVVTLDAKDPMLAQLERETRRHRAEKYIENVGPVPVAEGPALYERSDVCFLPTVLECFSATYPEAMAMGTPIVTTDLGFVRDICSDAALYFRPDDPVAAAHKLCELLADRELWETLVANGKRVLSGLPSPHEKYRQYVQLLELVATGQPVATAEAQEPVAVGDATGRGGDG